MPTVPQKNALIPDQLTDPKDLAKREKSIKSRDQAPTVGEQTTQKTDWTRLSTQLGPPFDSERITLAQCRQIRKDPMVGFGLHYRKVPLVESEWHIDARDKNGPNAQVAAFVDQALRKIFARLIFQRTLAYDFGFQAIVKRFQLANPGGVWLDPTETNLENQVKPIWDEGNILPVIWKAPTALKPELVEPRFDEKTGEFDGIGYTPPVGQRTQAMGFKSKRGGANQGTQIVDVYHSYWSTNAKDEEHGNIYGYPLVAYARDYWWNYRFLFMQSARAYERLAIPPVLAYHPEGSTLVDAATGLTRPNFEIALEAAERLRSNAVAAVPSTMASTGLDQVSPSQREWDFKFMETPTEALSIFDARFNYLNIMKLRSIWVPEQAFIEGSGGTSSRNVAAQMGDMFTASQSLAMKDIGDDIDRFWIPDILALNFPEFINNGGSAQFVSHGFKAQDIEIQKQVLQLVGQNDPTFLERLDLPKMLDSLNLPLRSPAEFAREQQAIADQQAQQPVPLVNPTPGNVGVVPTEQALGGATGGGSTPSPIAGFSDLPETMYIQPREAFELSDIDDFLSGLPTSKHYQDKTVRAQMMRIRSIWGKHYKKLYADIAARVGSVDSFAFADEDKKPVVSKSVDTTVVIPIAKAKKAARALLKDWSLGAKHLDKLLADTQGAMEKIVKRSMYLEMRSLKAQDAEIDQDEVDRFIAKQLGRLSKLTDQTIRDELSVFLTNHIRYGKSPQELAVEILEHYQGREITKANNVARSETRDLVNGATLLSSEAAGLKFVKGVDGEEFDPDCAARNGKLFPIKEAWQEIHREHTNGTLGFDPIARADFSIEYVKEMPEGVDEDVVGFFDDDSGTAYILYGDESAQEYLDQITDVLVVR